MPGTRFALEVQPRLPHRLARLQELAEDLLYSWDRQVRGLFRRLDSELWDSVRHNPKVFLRRISQYRLEAAAQDAIFLEDYNRAISTYDTYLQECIKTGIEHYLNPDTNLVAYFCAEFGFHESLPIYSGGLGILAGDHCKAASDLRLPFVAVGMLYRQGYFTQTINDQGHQVAHYMPTNFADLPVNPALDALGNEIRIAVALPGREVQLKVWQVKAGHIKLYLLDSDLADNTASDRSITYQLYGGDIVTRMQQEIVLGIGGVRALRALGHHPTVWHINEGHAAFQILERCREYVAAGLHFDTALEITAAATVFTTHTPVPAGHDIFDHDLMDTYFREFMGQLTLERERFFALGAFPGHDKSFNQTALALRGSRFHNGVSRVHGDVAARMESYIWPQIPAEENPISHVTNGIHVPTFLARDWANLFDMRFGGEWRRELLNESYWERIDEIPDHIYWSIRQSLKSELLQHVRKHAVVRYRRNGASEAQIERLTKHLDPQNMDVLIIGFARRFATYKRGALLFSDPERLAQLLNQARFPVLFIFAGKAHPRDVPGQQLIKTIHQFSQRPEFIGKIILLEGYDMALARQLVTGVDVWLNTPQFPMEASGTSGQKAGINGVINLSILDGWWAEGYTGENGWAIKPHGPEFDNGYRDQQEAQDLLDLLERQVIPLYYARPGSSPTGSGFTQRGERRTTNHPEGWVKMSKASMKSIMPRYNARRMVMDYVKHVYSAAAKHHRKLSAEDFGAAHALADWKCRVARLWPDIRMRRVDDCRAVVVAGETLPINVAAHLNGLDPSDVVLECVVGKENEWGEFVVHETHRFSAIGRNENGETLFKLALYPSLSGLQYYKIRMFPYHRLLSHHFETGFMLWL